MKTAELIGIIAGSVVFILLVVLIIRHYDLTQQPAAAPTPADTQQLADLLRKHKDADNARIQQQREEKYQKRSKILKAKQQRDQAPVAEQLTPEEILNKSFPDEG